MPFRTWLLAASASAASDSPVRSHSLVCTGDDFAGLALEMAEAALVGADVLAES
jgi:hypothetical protein